MVFQKGQTHLIGFVLLLFYGFLDIYSFNCGIEDFRLCLNEELAAFNTYLIIPKLSDCRGCRRYKEDAVPL